MFHAELFLPPDCLVFSKGMDPERDDYSALSARNAEGIPLSGFLRKEGTHRLYICGLATDYCVRHTALGGLQEGFSVTVLADAVRGVDLAPGDSDRALAEIENAGALLADIAAIEQGD
jgi:nicotinamidase/pyrazinamidase